jgi:hypothetical protein
VIKTQVNQVTRARTPIKTEHNIDSIIEVILKQPWMYSPLFFQLARDDDDSLDSVADLHAFNRLL